MCRLFCLFLVIAGLLRVKQAAMMPGGVTLPAMAPVSTRNRSRWAQHSNPVGKRMKRAASNLLSIVRKPLRDINFWARTVRIYSSYKAKQFRRKTTIGLRRVRRAVLHINSTSDLQLDYNATHEVNSRRMIDLCLSMRGFYLKTGQFLGTRHDFMPLAYISKLAKLHDDVPPLSGHEIRGILERELGGPVEDYFSSLDLDKPIGSASVAQVHRGVWRASGQAVAVKVQYPNAERLMRGDLQNLRCLAEFLQKHELKFDMLSAIKELQKQIKNEFDFVGEARNMDTIKAGLAGRAPVILPSSILATKRALVMTFVEGSNLSQLKEFKASVFTPAFVKRAYGKKLLDVLSTAWGAMIFDLRAFNADPHPGNICIGSGGTIGLLDWGQVKQVSDTLARKFGRMVLAISSRDESAIVDALFDLGVTVSNPSDRKTVTDIAITMLDTKRVAGYIIDPFNPRNSLKTNSVTKMPSDLYFVVRTVQLLRGIAHAFDLDYSLADKWAPYARRAVYREEREIEASRSKK